MYPRGSLEVIYRALVTWWSGLAYGRKRVAPFCTGSAVGDGRGSCVAAAVAMEEETATLFISSLGGEKQQRKNKQK